MRVLMPKRRLEVLHPEPHEVVHAVSDKNGNYFIAARGRMRGVKGQNIVAWLLDANGNLKSGQVLHTLRGTHWTIGFGGLPAAATANYYLIVAENGSSRANL